VELSGDALAFLQSGRVDLFGVKLLTVLTAGFGTTWHEP